MILKIMLPLLAVVAGMVMAVQGQVNGGLGKKVGVLEGSFISFSIGTIALLLCLVFFGNGNISAISSVPKWQLTGGLLGAFYVLVMVFVVPKIGVSAALIAVIAGQIILGAVIDHFGFFGGNRFPFDKQKAIAIVLLFAALYLYNKK
ncbi:transporter family-2 protein [Lysinibacillus composti]|uniref:DMT family transporter n=1 Tax=Lysinibacillus composti TaxID=720633 RepID=A0A3N9UBQ7_9BACI|nr:DMT family transporter [Lysinibacillus composti]MBM7609531.1 transporter family-2 protein [Lysinibacillus composti]RQW73874.1 DMT family transporter [Lysinibacillus composti]